MRARDVGIEIGTGRARVRSTRSPTSRACGSATARWSRAGELVVGRGPVRTGVTVVLPARRPTLDRAGVRRVPPPQRLRRADRPGVAARVGDADQPDRADEHQQRGDRAGHDDRPGGRGAGAAADHAAGGRRDLGRDPQRHRRPARAAGARRTRRSTTPGPVRSPRATSVAAPGCSATGSRAGPARPRGWCALGGAHVHRRGAGAGQPRRPPALRGQRGARSGQILGWREVPVPRMSADHPGAAGHRLGARGGGHRRPDAAAPAEPAGPARGAGDRQVRGAGGQLLRRPDDRVLDRGARPARPGARGAHADRADRGDPGAAVRGRHVRRRDRGHRRGHPQRDAAGRDDGRARRPRPARPERRQLAEILDRHGRRRYSVR